MAIACENLMAVTGGNLPPFVTHSLDEVISFKMKVLEGILNHHLSFSFKFWTDAMTWILAKLAPIQLKRDLQHDITPYFHEHGVL